MNVSSRLSLPLSLSLTHIHTIAVYVRFLSLFHKRWIFFSSFIASSCNFHFLPYLDKRYNRPSCSRFEDSLHKLVSESVCLKFMLKFELVEIFRKQFKHKFQLVFVMTVVMLFCFLQVFQILVSY